MGTPDKRSSADLILWAMRIARSFTIRAAFTHDAMRGPVYRSRSLRNRARCRATIRMRMRDNQDENPVWGERRRA